MDKRDREYKMVITDCDNCGQDILVVKSALYHRACVMTFCQQCMTKEPLSTDPIIGDYTHHVIGVRVNITENPIISDGGYLFNKKGEIVGIVNGN